MPSDETELISLAAERLKRLRVPTVSETAAQVIRDAIITGELKSDDRLPEQKWANRFGIGQPTLREALKELEYQGFVEKRGSRGTYVSRLDAGDYRAILEVRLPLEATAFRQAARRVTPEIESELSAHVMKMGSAGENNDLLAFHQNDIAFHRRIWDLAENKYLRMTLEALCFRLFVFSVVGRPRNWFRAAVQQHLEYLEALCSGDPDKAEQGFLIATTRYWDGQYKIGIGEQFHAAAASDRPENQ